MATPPPNKFEITKNFPTPLIGDVLLYETRDSKTGPSSVAPEYGKKHWNPDKYPHHELVYVSPADQQGKQQWIWAAKRNYQDLYNFEITYPYGGLRENPRYTRSYVIKRSEYAPIVNGSLDPIHDGIITPSEQPAVLISEVMTRIGIQELDSLYVAVIRVYDTIPLASAQTGFGYTLSYPYQDDAYPRLTWRFSIRRSTYSPAPELSACPIPSWTHLKLTEQPQAESGLSENQIIVVTRVYDTLPGPVLTKDRLERDCRPPQQFVHKANVLEDTIRLEAPTAEPLPLTGDIQTSEVSPEGKATASRVTVSYIPLEIDDLVGSDIDPETGKSFSYTMKSVDAGTVSTTPVNADGIGTIVKPYNTCYSIQTIRKIVGLAGNPRTYRKLINFYWPKVIWSLNLQAITDRDGNIVKTSQWVTGRDPYKGPCTCTITDSWSPVAPEVSVPTQMLPKPMQWDMVFSNGNYEDSLHTGIIVGETSGTEHPDYAYFVNTATFPATNFTDWPATIVAIDEVTPHFGGYLRTIIVVDRPNIGI